MEVEIIETPRERIKRLNNQVKYWRCYGYSKYGEQELCTFCRHWRCTPDVDGNYDVDCLAPNSKFDSGEPVRACRKFKAIKNWAYAIEHYLTWMLAEIIKDQCDTYTKNDIKARG